MKRGCIRTTQAPSIKRRVRTGQEDKNEICHKLRQQLDMLVPCPHMLRMSAMTAGNTKVSSTTNGHLANGTGEHVGSTSTTPYHILFIQAWGKGDIVRGRGYCQGYR